MYEILKAVILGVVEGITEFLPISSTGHLIIVNQFISFGEDFTKMFDVVIQLGAIASVLIYFRKKLFSGLRFDRSFFKTQTFDLWMKACIGVIPALFFGALFHDFIEEKLFNPIVVACSLIIGGVILLILENKTKQESFTQIKDLKIKTVVLIGLAQCLAMIPGTSRSAATIIGAMFLGSSRVLAAEFSFYLAIPTMFAASTFSLIKSGFEMTTNEFMLLLVGFITSFIVAFLVIAFFMDYISKNDFKPFGIYRIGLGVLVLWYFL